MSHPVCFGGDFILLDAKLQKLQLQQNQSGKKFFFPVWQKKQKGNLVKVFPQEGSALTFRVDVLAREFFLSESEILAAAEGGSLTNLLARQIEILFAAQLLGVPAHEREQLSKSGQLESEVVLKIQQLSYELFVPPSDVISALWYGQLASLHKQVDIAKQALQNQTVQAMVANYDVRVTALYTRTGANTGLTLNTLQKIVEVAFRCLGGVGQGRAVKFKMSIEKKVYHILTKRDERLSLICSKGQLAEGNFGKIFRALALHTGDTVVLKKPTKHREAESCCFNEVKILQAIHQDPWVEGIQEAPYEVFCSGTGEILGYTGKLYEGDLFTFLALSSSIRAWPLIRKMEQACILLNALCYLQEHDIKHSDIKLENILVGRMGEFVIADFGGAKFFREIVLSQLSERGAMAGTFSPGYTCRADITELQNAALTNNMEEYRKIQKAHDCFGLAMVLFALFTLRTPFEQDAKGFPLVIDPLPQERRNWLKDAGLPEMVISTIANLLCYDYRGRMPVAQALQIFKDALEILRNVESVPRPSSSHSDKKQQIGVG